MHPAPIVLVVASALGWGEIALQPSKADRTFSAWQQSVAALDRPSPRTLETLKRHGLEDHFRSDPGNALAVLERQARSGPESELVFALAELSWIEGRRLDRRRKPEALDRFLDTVAYAFDYLFDPDLASGRHPTDPRYRLACDLYNAGLDRLIRAAQANGRIQPGDTIRLKIHGQEQALRIELKSTWGAADVHQLLLAADFEVTGLDSLSRYQYGLGVPLIAVRATDHDEVKGGPERFYPRELAFPLTAFLRPTSKLRDDPGGGARDCTLDLVDPIRYQAVGPLLLEADLTTPLAYMWSRTDLNRYRWTGLLRPGDAAGRAGLMLLRPYEPDKIPVVMVHGLASSPLAWIPMLNELLRDPQIHKRYQFLLYLYPTGIPIPIAAAGLRETLREVQTEFDPRGDSPTFRRMVLLGHSMGGLLSHAMVVASANRFWELNTDRRFDEMIGPPEVLEELRRYLFFEPLPFVRRVVYLAVPHRGSELSRGVVGRVGAGLISEPDHISDLLARLHKDNPYAFDRRKFRRLPTSIETLDPDSDLLPALLEMKPGPGVTFHSIIGSNRPGGSRTSTDGVVPYRSAHLDGVASERVVRSDHGVQKAPEAILEVRRILLEHLGLAVAGGPVPDAPPR
ncbi:MAG TPA: alpha/beta fold hydrolase [Isosphaeraceae bacterium]|jgi:pimeloyl-ACP methyl ester carboxylesterase